MYPFWQLVYSMKARTTLHSLTTIHIHPQPFAIDHTAFLVYGTFIQYVSHALFPLTVHCLNNCHLYDSVPCQAPAFSKISLQNLSQLMSLLLLSSPPSNI